MKIFSTLHIGSAHQNHCEDYLVHAPIGTQQHLIAVMDGCSMGTDSYFVATLTGKLLRKIAWEQYCKSFAEQAAYDPPFLLDFTAKVLFQSLKTTVQTLQLKREETLHTLILGIIDEHTKNAAFLCIGDGLICVNGQFHEFDHDNRPDYLGYHLHENVDHYIDNHPQKIFIEQLQDASISTDGIYSFRPYSNKRFPNPPNLLHYLLTDRQLVDTNNMLDRKVKDIHAEWGLAPFDDLGIIRVTL
ncbi:hypothetical protein LX64_01115 [Chitinophaga skermanii]|uniref:PPM-type phosphatase domain-containing protein n=1 Tax=Chitinophaga skermanii TaxID=331697 RepID=A0A327QYG8_9BACT|nr:protein phosphatase 2C domain-containing protein [Chitinophaga skermanii]RAJ08463.1 hypothetical protein LX64_01115 [Chitinophaga skermanii]